MLAGLGKRLHDRQSVNRRHGGGWGGADGAPPAAELVLAAAQIDSVRYHIQMWRLGVLEDWGSAR